MWICVWRFVIYLILNIVRFCVFNLGVIISEEIWINNESHYSGIYVVVMTCRHSREYECIDIHSCGHLRPTKNNIQEFLEHTRNTLDDVLLSYRKCRLTTISMVDKLKNLQVLRCLKYLRGLLRGKSKHYIDHMVTWSLMNML